MFNPNDYEVARSRNPYFYTFVNKRSGFDIRIDNEPVYFRDRSSAGRGLAREHAKAAERSVSMC
jgi:hypothetical protein